MRVGGQSAAFDFLAKAQQLGFVQAAFQVGARIDAGTRMSLHEHHVPGMGRALGAPEMIEADFVERRRRCVRSEVAAVFRILAIRLHHHGERIPAYVSLVAPLEGSIARIVRLLRLGDGIEVGGIRLERQVGTRAPREVHQFFEQKMRAFRTLRAQDGIDRLQPLLRLDGINVFERRLLSHKCTRPRVLLRWRHVTAPMR